MFHKLILLLFLHLFTIFGCTVAAIQKTQVEITTYRYDYPETTRLIALMKTGRPPPFHSFSTRIYYVQNKVCNNYKKKTFSFSMGPHLDFECPMHDGMASVRINNTHELACPTYCEVCQEKLTCSRAKSLAGIFYTPDGRKIDSFSMHYATLDVVKDRTIDWFIVTCYIVLFTLFTNVVSFVFTD